jgi:hypothetical protein
MVSAPPSSPRNAWRCAHGANVALRPPAHGPSGGTLVATYAYEAGDRRIGKVVSGRTFERYGYADVETVGVCDGSR